MLKACFVSNNVRTYKIFHEILLTFHNLKLHGVVEKLNDVNLCYDMV